MSKLKIMYFSAPWCGPCRMFGPMFDEVVSAFTDIDVQKINVDETPDLSRENMVTSIPTVIITKDDEQIMRKAGVMSRTELTNVIEKNK